MTGSDATILVVDDEEMVVTSVRGFLELETPYRILTFTSPEAALERAEEEEGRLDVILADFMMPGMDGIELLRRIREVRPSATRILLTGYADKESAIRAINEVGLYHYLEKPWDNERLLLIVRNAVERSKLFNELDSRVGALEEANEELQKFRQRLVSAFL